MPLRILFRLIGVVILTLASLAGIAAFDATCNSSKLLKNLLERSLSRSEFQVSIESVSPKYLARQLRVSNVRAFWRGHMVAKLESADCIFSLSKLCNIDVNIKANELVTCDLPLHLDNCNLKASLGILTGNKEVWVYKSCSSLAHFRREGSSIFASLEPALNPRVIRSKCTAEIFLNSQGRIKSVISSGELDELSLKSNNRHLSQISLVSAQWHCNVDSSILTAIDKQDLEFKATFHKDGKPFSKVLGKLNSGDATVLLDFASGESQAFYLKAESSILKGSGPIRGGLRTAIKHLTDLRFLKDVSVKDARKDVCNWNASFDLSDGKFNIILNSSFDSCKFVLRGKMLPARSTHTTLLLSKEHYQLSLDSTFDGNLCLKATAEGNVESHTIKGSIRTDKELSFPEATLLLKPSVCTFAGKVEKKQGDKLSFHISSDLSDLSFLFDKYGFIKPAGCSAELQLSGVFYGSVGAVQGTFISADNAAVSGSYFTDGNLTQVDLDNVIYAKSHYSLKAESTQAHLKTEINGSCLDLSCANLSAWVAPKYRTKPKDIVAVLDNLYMKNDKAVSNVAMYSSYNGKHYTGCLFQGDLGSTGFINVTLDGSDSTNVSEGWVCKANDLGYVMQALGLYRGVKNGFLDLTFDVDRIGVTQESPAPLVYGNIRSQKFRVEKIPFFLWVTCPSALVRLFAERKYSNFESASASFCILGKELSIERGSVKSFSSDIVLYKSKISPKGILLRGGVAPSWYGLGNLVRWTPVVGDMLKLIQLPGVWIPFVWRKEFH